MKPAALLALTAGALCAQTVQVYSEFAQINDAGEVVAPANPREILSPAVARNAFSSFQIAIQVPKGTKFLVYMGQNPDDAAKVILYRRRVDKLEPIELPYTGESSQVLWMDLWLDPNAPVRRVKIEPQVGIDGAWITYPMEVRVMEPVLPNSAIPTQGVASPFEVMRGFLCGTKTRPLAGRVPAGAELLFRNAQQDVVLAAAGSMPLREEMRKAMGGCSANPPADPEFYLRLRDYLFTPLWKKVR
ncbi:MAG TPA: hypothetical protein VLM42_06845 [Bryobacteraceae bacterium]|nr:hypothetical protein [Bryobacteraceae bacterium]